MLVKDNMKHGKLYIIPTPIAPDLPLELKAKELLLSLDPQSSDMILIEEPKATRQRWIQWGLDRRFIDKFISYNEQSRHKIKNQIIENLIQGANAYLISDGGLPAFCDPGQELIDLCHQKSITVTSTPFPHAIALAVSLSGFKMDQYFFAGFLPQKDPERSKDLARALKQKEAVIFMDTAYRLGRLISEIDEMGSEQLFFLATELNKENELLIRGTIKKIKSLLPDEKREFILIKNGVEIK